MQEDFIKINFWLGGQHTTVLDGWGQHDHGRPEVFITAGPTDMLKVDLFSASTRTESVALCIRKEFFPCHMGLQPDELPDPLRTLAAGKFDSYTFQRLALRPDMWAAARAVLAAPFEVRRDPIYLQAKAIELMCLLVNYLSEQSTGSQHKIYSRNESKLREARALILKHFAVPLTLESIGRDVGLNRMALASGFRALFGVSVHDYLRNVRMERAFELLLRTDQSAQLIAETVGYRYATNFSIAFHAHFGCTPREARKLDAVLPIA